MYSEDDQLNSDPDSAMENTGQPTYNINTQGGIYAEGGINVNQGDLVNGDKIIFNLNVTTQNALQTPDFPKEVLEKIIALVRSADTTSDTGAIGLLKQNAIQSSGIPAEVLTAYLKRLAETGQMMNIPEYLDADIIKRVLLLLYKAHKSQRRDARSLGLETIVKELGIFKDALCPHLEYLSEQGYINNQTIKTGVRVYFYYSITDKGLRAVK
jgi:hypothetical protein